MPPSRDAPRRTARPVGAAGGPAAQTIPPGRPRAPTGLRGRIGAAGGRDGETAPGERPACPSGRRRARGPTSPSVRPAPTAPLSPPGRHCRLRSGAGRYAARTLRPPSRRRPRRRPHRRPATRTAHGRRGRTDRAPDSVDAERAGARRTGRTVRSVSIDRLHRPAETIGMGRPTQSDVDADIFLAPLPPTWRTTPETVAGQGFTGYHHPRDTPRDTRICQTPPASL